MKKNLVSLVLLILGVSGSIIYLQTQAENSPLPPQEIPITVSKSPAEPRHKSSIDEVLFPVTRVVDGDTIIVDIHGVDERVRLIGVNTPETVDPRRAVECFGKEASLFLKNTLSEKSVRLEPDSTQGDRDKYGRLLRYVFLSDGTFINKLIIEKGYGYEYTYRLPYRYQKEFKQAEVEAHTKETGLWAVSTCKGIK